MSKLYVQYDENGAPLSVCGDIFGDIVPVAWTEVDEETYMAAIRALGLDRTEEDTEREQRIAALKEQLAETDYKAIKFAEGWIDEVDYIPIKYERQRIRDEINRLEGKEQ